MKIFALNLSLEFLVKDPKSQPPYDVITFADLMAHFFKGKILPNQQFFVEGIDREDFSKDIFELQAHESWRHSEASVTFYFTNKAALTRFEDAFTRRFQAMDAAGGLVENEKGEYLFILSRNRWTLPKGGIEWGESNEEAAIREVQEETGIDHLEVVEALPAALHTFQRGSRWILKTTHWYKLRGLSSDPLAPQAEEGIDEAVWISRNRWQEIAADAYPQIRDLMEHELSRSLRIS